VLLDQDFEFFKLLIAESEVGCGVSVGQNRQNTDNVWVSISQNWGTEPNRQGQR
jgi:hypothetical protein